MKKLIKLSRVRLVYSGISGACYCGCSGTYWDLEKSFGSTPKEVIFLKIKRIVNKLNKNLDLVLDVDEEIKTLTIGKHDWTVYLKPYSNLDYLEERYEEKLKNKPLTK